MVINHKYRFCYFAIPRTGSQATTKLLVEEFDSEVIMKMHTNYDEFMEEASADEKTYFTFCAVRNPLDSLVSSFYKMKSDHNGRFSRGTFLRSGRPLAPKVLEQYRFITENNASFVEFFLRFHTQPFRRPRHERTAKQVDFIMHFETLQADLDKVLDRLSLPQKTIPTKNPTQGRSKSFLEYYTPEVIPQTKSVMTDIMQAWGYEFPEEWQAYR